MLSYKIQKGFTLIELIVVVTILAILATIGYTSYIGYQGSSRDAIRMSTITSIGKVSELTLLETGSLPSVTNPIAVTFSGSTIWQQGTFGTGSLADAKRLSEVPTDPLTGSEYAYSTTSSSNEYQVGGILEKGGGLWSYNLSLPQAQAAVLPEFQSSFVRGSYNGKFITYSEQIIPSGRHIYLLGVPSILTTSIESVDLNTIYTNNGFIYNGKKSVPGSFSGTLDTTGTGWDFTPTVTADGTRTGFDFVIYKGTEDELGTGTGKLDMISKLQDYYATTDVVSDTNKRELVTINTITDPNTAIALANTYINTGIGGIGKVPVTEVSQEETTYNGWLDCIFGTHTFGEGCVFGG